eukprot:TRINITY_DN82508_c0_g1_i1.p1 TRINITY_DN82508_c0_g1~~TRINITY_DN82508_c0_g1_i1.p1  ORF type:complete len:409 (-),score=75.45 TRINITY_DN82508_c0_g1_i1:81-1307(-)
MAVDKQNSSLPLTPVVQAANMTHSEFENLHAEGVPFVIRGVCSEDAAAKWVASVLSQCAHMEVTCTKIAKDGTCEHVARTLQEFAVGEGRLGDVDAGWALMDESLCEGTGVAEEIASLLPSALQTANNWFYSLFPEALRPSPLCLCAAGRRGMCDLHADPLGWTGWNLLLTADAAKRWAFLPPSKEANAALAPIDDYPFGLRAQDGMLLAQIGAGQTSRSCLYDLSVEEGHSSVIPGALEVLQMPGDLLVFPGHWWHQTLSESETWAVASQCLNCQNAPRVCEHIDSYRGQRSKRRREMVDDAAEPEQHVRALLETTVAAALHENACAQIRESEISGSELLARLRAWDEAQEAAHAAGGWAKVARRLAKEEAARLAWTLDLLKVPDQEALIALRAASNLSKSEQISRT